MTSPRGCEVSKWRVLIGAQKLHQSKRENKFFKNTHWVQNLNSRVFVAGNVECAGRACERQRCHLGSGQISISITFQTNRKSMIFFTCISQAHNICTNLAIVPSRKLSDFFWIIIYKKYNIRAHETRCAVGLSHLADIKITLIFLYANV